MIGKKINGLRISRGLTTRRLAKELGTSSSCISKWERGESIPRSAMIERIATYFGVTIGELTDSKPLKINGVKFDPIRFEQSLSNSRLLDEDSKTLINIMIDQLLEKKKLFDYKAKIEQLK